MYYIISQDGDGGICIEQLSGPNMQHKMDEWCKEDCIPTILDKGYEKDPQYWPEYSVLIIKGNVVIPKEAKQVTKLEIE